MFELYVLSRCSGVVHNVQGAGGYTGLPREGKVTGLIDPFLSQ